MWPRGGTAFERVIYDGAGMQMRRTRGFVRQDLVWVGGEKPNFKFQIPEKLQGPKDIVGNRGAF
jgi:hypothetical protein